MRREVKVWKIKSERVGESEGRVRRSIAKEVGRGNTPTNGTKRAHPPDRAFAGFQNIHAKNAFIL